MKTINNNAPHLKSPKNQNRRAALGRLAIKITGGLQLVFGRPTLALGSALVPQTLSCLVCMDDSCPLYNFDTVRDNFTKLGRNIKHDRRRAEINNSCSTCIFGGIIPLCNFPYRNCVHSIALIPLDIIS